MAYSDVFGRSTAHLLVATSLALTLGLGTIGATSALAQESTTQATDQAAQPAAGTDAKKVSAWVKICDKVNVSKEKDKKDEKQVCLTQHERFDPNSGSLMVSAAIREIEGQDKKALLVGVPLGMVIPPGMAIFVDEEKDPTLLKFDVCLPTGCTAEIEATPELMDKMSKGKMATVVATSIQGEKIGFRVPLQGFATSLTGKPADTTQFLNARKKLLLRLREQLIAKAKAQQEAAQAAVQGATEMQQQQGGDATATTGTTQN